MSLKTPEEVDLSPEIQEKLDKIKTIFTDQRVIVGYSGGMDSTLMCYLAKLYAVDVLPVIVNDPTTPSQELRQADEFTKLFGIPLRVIELDTLDIPEFSQNSPDRCYYCKQNLLTALEKIAEEEDYTMVVDGTNFSDLSDTRPGLRALQESHTRSPLAEAEITKPEIKEISKALNLPSFNLPSQACLASRVPFYTPITLAMLKTIDEAEQFIRDLLQDNSIPLRVRIHPLGTDGKKLARIESDERFFSALADSKIRNQILVKFVELGFTFTTLDLEGFITGKMHRIIN
jgi:pyridinium-3,5-biscarboxylic acid mononucleotide sulfurtransferase